MNPIYLDFNASTPVAADVVQAMQPYLLRHYGNPSSSHSLGRAAMEAVEDARMHVAAALGADRDEIFFTSGGTESNNLALIGSLLDGPKQFRGHVVTSQIEHPAVSQPIRFMEQMGLVVTRVPSNTDGVVTLEAVMSALRNDTRLVSIMHANNETGVIQPVEEIAEVLQERDIVFHTDAAQSFGKIPTQVDELGVNLLSIAGHKCYAPKGVGALYVRFGTTVHPVLRGADHERGLRPGTENVPGIVGLGKACQLIVKQRDAASQAMRKRRDRLFDLLSADIPGLMINGRESNRLPNTLSVVFPKVQAQELLGRAAIICASTGAACHSGTAARSPTLENLGLSLNQAQGTVRFSLGWETSDIEIEQAAAALTHAWHSLGSGNPSTTA